MIMVYVKSYGEPPFNIKEIMRYSGIGTLTDDMEILLGECIGEVSGKLSYKVCYEELPLSFCDEYTIMGTIRTPSKDIRKTLQNCSRVIAFAATVGIEIDRIIAKYSSLAPSKAICFQAIGAERIEALCDMFCKDISGQIFRFSPGYGDFSIEMQRDIFTLLDPPRRIGLTLNDSLLMSPSKSVTAIVGICRQDGAEIIKHSCDACLKTDCEYRRKR